MTAGGHAVIYHGPMGTAAYQQLHITMQPMRSLPDQYDTSKTRFRLKVAECLQPRVRGFARWWYSLRWRGRIKKDTQKRRYILGDNYERFNDYEAKWWSEDESVSRMDVLEAIRGTGWQVLGNDTDWDMERDAMRLLVACESHRSGVLVLTRVEMGERSGGVLPVDLVQALEALGLARM